MKITTVDDYIPKLKSMFPTIKESDLKKILTYGWKQFYLLNSYGGDFFTADYDIWFYSGNLFKDSIKHFDNYINKLGIKLRVMYRRKKIEWDGYYYFALSLEQYDNLMALKRKRGRPRKIFLYGDVFAYKIFDECKLREFNRQYIFRLKYPTDLGFVAHFKDLKTENAELIDTHDILKFKDILVTNYNYKFL